MPVEPKISRWLALLFKPIAALPLPEHRQRGQIVRFSPGLEYFLVANENDATVSVIDIAEKRTLAHVPVGKGCEILAYFRR